ncbi:conserved hypothetical protein [Methylomarinovum caldicuralii]|uniref:TIGR00703 family protein n=1 Tax=Methylomarinovum caldicuralii TaxID=438856 RepID=A0AAU9C1N6_9GAMM|nr:TIGR00703 family protein [Methylomarinovum caldicuralii]BCX81009.1 conserved hypothetical protein [Methylomarinovum caldicuralii]
MTPQELRELIALNTLVFETLGQPEKEREFRFKSLKRWGLDLIAGRRNGETTFFTGAVDRHRAQDVYEEGGSRFEVEEILTELPKNKKLYAHIAMAEGTAMLIGQLREGDENIEILRLPAASLLMAYCKKQRLSQVAEAIRSVGAATELAKQRGQEGKPVSFEQLPNVPRRFLREAKKVEKEMGFGRVALAYFGENKDRDARFRLSWLVPTIALFEIDIAEKVDKLLAAFK